MQIFLATDKGLISLAQVEMVVKDKHGLYTFYMVSGKIISSCGLPDHSKEMLKQFTFRGRDEA